MPSATTLTCCLAVSALVLVFGPAARPALAQGTAPRTAAASSTNIDIPALPKAKVTLEVDARNDDLLGLVKQVNFGGIPLAEALGDITHLRVVTYQRPAGNGTLEPASGFYEDAFRQAGARRTFFSDRDGNRTLVLTFDRPRRQIAVILEKENEITIARTDGYPDLQKLSPFIAMFLPGFQISGTGATTSAATK